MAARGRSASAQAEERELHEQSVQLQRVGVVQQCWTTDGQGGPGEKGTGASGTAQGPCPWVIAEDEDGW